MQEVVVEQQKNKHTKSCQRRDNNRRSDFEFTQVEGCRNPNERDATLLARMTSTHSHKKTRQKSTTEKMGAEKLGIIRINPLPSDDQQQNIKSQVVGSEIDKIVLDAVLQPRKVGHVELFEAL